MIQEQDHNSRMSRRKFAMVSLLGLAIAASGWLIFTHWRNKPFSVVINSVIKNGRLMMLTDEGCSFVSPRWASAEPSTVPQIQDEIDVQFEFVGDKNPKREIEVVLCVKDASGHVFFEQSQVHHDKRILDPSLKDMSPQFVASRANDAKFHLDRGSVEKMAALEFRFRQLN